jgi:hypothetical protein
MNLRTLITACLLIVAGECWSKEPQVLPRSVWHNKLERVEYHRVPMTTAVEVLVKLHQEQHPNDKRLSGFLILDADKTGSTVTMDLRDVPLGEACQLIAEAAGWRFTLQDRTVCFFPAGSGYYTDSAQVLALTPEVAVNLKVGTQWDLPKIIDNLKLLKVRTDSFNTIELKEAEGSSYLVVEGDREEGEVLRGLWKLLRRK